MIATATRPNGKLHETLERVALLEEQYLEARKSREPKQGYLAGESDRMNPVPKGIDPLGTVAEFAKTKPIIAFVEDMCASAGVSIASQATKRYLPVRGEVDALVERYRPPETTKAAQ